MGREGAISPTKVIVLPPAPAGIVNDGPVVHGGLLPSEQDGAVVVHAAMPTAIARRPPRRHMPM
jgi:hypothetical protein